MIPLAIPNLNGNEKKYLDACIETNFVSSVGKYVTEMEDMICKATGSPSAVCTSSGTTGLHVSLTALGIGYGDLVMIPTFTFIATANSVAHCGALPWLIDIDKNDWCMNLDLVEKEMAQKCEIREGKVIHLPTGRKVGAIMPVFTLGNIPNMERLRSIADAWGLPLIADAACAIGAKYKGQTLGLLADLSVLSFNGNKTITCGGGGAVIGSDEKLLEHVRHLTTTARVWPDYDFDEVGFNYRMTNVQAAVGVAQMERLDLFVEKKIEIREYYNRAFSDLSNITMFPSTDGSSCWFSGIVLPKDTSYETTKGLVDDLNKRGIEARPFWKPVHLQKPYINSPKSETINTDELWERIITLPCSTGISDDELGEVSESVHEVIHMKIQ